MYAASVEGIGPLTVLHWNEFAGVPSALWYVSGTTAAGVLGHDIAAGSVAEPLPEVLQAQGAGEASHVACPGAATDRPILTLQEPELLDIVLTASSTPPASTSANAGQAAPAHGLSPSAAVAELAGLHLHNALVAGQRGSDAGSFGSEASSSRLAAALSDVAAKFAQVRGLPASFVQLDAVACPSCTWTHRACRARSAASSPRWSKSSPR